MIKQLDNGKVRITFEKPIVDLTGTPKAFCTLRQPTFGEYLDFGDPVQMMVGAAGIVDIEDREALKGWIARLIEDHDFDIIQLRGTYIDCLALIDGVHGFFLKGRAALKKLQGDALAPDAL
jgi:hypothetical protein